MEQSTHSPSTLAAHSISKSFRNRCIVNEVSFHLNQGEVVGLLGPNGAGKTTSFYMIVGLLYPDSGRVTLNGKDITRMPMHARAKNGIGYLPQNMSIFRKLTVAQNLLAVMQVAGIPAVARQTLLNELLDRFQIKHLSKSIGSALSGGERRRVEIARSLVMRPAFLLLDEPFAGVDPVTVQEIQSVINNLKNQKLGVLITDHNVRETLDSCDRVYVLFEGKIVASGTPQEVTNSHFVREIYLGSKFKM
jgi:lipopolysaccharide export system ATP-binding protein